jgi:ribonuclease HI
MEIQMPATPIEHETWAMYFIGSLTKEGRGVGLVFISPLGVRMEYMIRLHFPVSNNVVEYEALLNGLKITLKIGVWHLEVRWDSELAVNQMMKEANCVNPKMAACCKAVRQLEDKFHGLELKHEVADTLTKVASNRTPVPNGVSASDLREPSVRYGEDDYPSPPDLQGVMVVREVSEPNLEDHDWRIPILEWMVQGKLPTDTTEARRIARLAKSFGLIDGDLYRQGEVGILMRCFLMDQGH